MRLIKVIITIGTAALVVGGIGSCSVEQREVSRQVSPDQKLIAVMMESLSGGAAASVQENIYLNDQGITLNLDKPVFSAVGCDRLSYQWLNNYTLQIHYETTCAIGHFTNRWFRPSDVAAGRPNPIEIILIRG